MRVSRFLLSTLKEAPAEAEVVSHRLMLRAGMIKRLAAGIYTWLPLGVRVLRKVEAIVREEMDRAGRDRAADAGRAARRAVAGVRPLGRNTAPSCCASRTGTNATSSSSRRPRRSSPTSRARSSELQAAADQPVSHPDQVPRRDPAALRRDALARVHHEGRVFVRRRQGRRCCKSYRAMYDAYTRIFTRMGSKFRAVAADTGPDRRQRVARIPGARRIGRGRDRVVPRVRLRGERRARRSGCARRRRARRRRSRCRRCRRPARRRARTSPSCWGCRSSRTVKCIMLATEHRRAAPRRSGCC